MADWTKDFAEDLWLKPDDVGAEEAAFLKKALHLRRGQSVLDAPCGAGRIAIHLARAGCVVTGIDLRPSFTGRAASRFRRERQSGRCLPMDLREMSFHGEFHAAYCWGGSFGYFEDSVNLDVMRRYAEASRRGGRLLIDQANRECLLRHFRPSRANGDVTIKNRWVPVTERVEGDWIVERSGKVEHNRTSIRLYTAVQMRRLFERVGLTVETMYGSFNGEPYSRPSRRLIVVGRKAARNTRRPDAAHYKGEGR